VPGGLNASDLKKLYRVRNIPRFLSLGGANTSKIFATRRVGQGTK
jgi:hypothetical protein